MGMGFGPLMTGAGAAQGLQDLLKQRLLEREMALREKAQADELDYRNRSLAADQDNAAAMREATDAYRQAQIGLDAERIGATETANAARLTPFKANLPVNTATNFKARGYPVSGPSDEQLASPMANEAMPPYQFEGNAPDPAKPTSTLYPLNKGGQKFYGTAEEAATTPAWVDPPSPRAQGMVTPSQKFQMERTLRSEWNKLTANWRTMKGQVATMEAGLAAARQGDMAAGAQAVLVTFQKILDPTSVVRESEYARSAEGQSALNQIKGFTDRLARGGVGVPMAELEKFYTLGKSMVARAAQELPNIRTQFEDNAVEYGLNPRLIIAEDPAEATEAAQPPEAAIGATAGRVYYDSNGKPIKR